MFGHITDLTSFVARNEHQGSTLADRVPSKDIAVNHDERNDKFTMQRLRHPPATQSNAIRTNYSIKPVDHRLLSPEGLRVTKRPISPTRSHRNHTFEVLLLTITTIDEAPQETFVLTEIFPDLPFYPVCGFLLPFAFPLDLVWTRPR